MHSENPRFTIKTLTEAEMNQQRIDALVEAYTMVDPTYLRVYRATDRNDAFYVSNPYTPDTMTVLPQDIPFMLLQSAKELVKYDEE